jgi:DNA-binding CsgD family transcriptional regulator
VQSCPASRAPSLNELTESPGYFARVGEVALRIDGAQDLAELVDLLHEATTQLGADVAAFLSFVGDADSWQSFRYVLACDPQWCVEYEKYAWYAEDPWLAYARRHADPIRTRGLRLVGDKQQVLANLAERYGFRSTVLIPVPSGNGLTRLGLLCLGSNTEAHFDGEGFAAFRVAARPVAIALHDWWVVQSRRELIDSSGITPEDLALLNYRRLGSRTKQIAQAMHLTEAAINSRSQRLLVKLGANNRKEAARIAAEYGLI